MAQQHLDPTDPTAEAVTGDALAGYLRAQATEFLRALRLRRETGGNGAGAGARGHAATGSAQASVDAARALRRSARRISGSLHTFRPLLDPDWAEEMRPELAWLSGTLGLEHAYEARLDRLLLALHRLSGSTAFPAQTVTAAAAAPVDVTAGGRAAATAGGGDTATAVTAGGRAAGAAPVPLKAAPGTGGPAGRTAAPERGNLTVGAAKAGALLERQLTLARTRAHSTALQALGSSRFHAVADKVAVLASEVPLTPTAPGTDLHPLAAAAQERLTDAVAALPLVTAGHPYNAEALVHGLSPEPSPHPQDGPWHQVRLLLRLHRYAREVLHGGEAHADVRLLTSGQALNRHRDASEAAAAAAQAARTPRITPATAYALGVLHADQRHEVEAARFAFQQAWQRQTVDAP
ncbi:CHAD domain-containing protein [Streptomyces sp. Caat 7-52]|uniref:CHAD domain-containing protein n=1 Tax=Streptomyces sp. Caat 7-52 TaxID=2949637 RepID=UPI0020351ACE|nr:CHAD domain-containing protein [Streptomyces sp. Caat 7-52]